MSRLLNEVMQAVVDGTPIDWNAARGAVQASERPLVDRLQFLHALRRESVADTSAHARTWSAPLLVRLVLVGAVLQTLAGAILLANAAFLGQVSGERLLQILLGAAFVLASASMAALLPCNDASTPLLAWFAAIGAVFAASALGGVPTAEHNPLSNLLRATSLEAFLPACLWQFASGFPRVRRFTRFDRLVRSVTWMAWTIGLALFAINLLITYGLVPAPSWTRLQRGAPGDVFSYTVMFALAGALVVIIVRARRASPAARTKVTRLAGALALGTAPFFLFNVARALVPGFSRLVPSDGTAATSVHFMVALGLLTTPVQTVWTIAVDRPFGTRALPIRTISTRELALLFACVTPFVLFASELYTRRTLPLDDLISRPSSLRLAAWLLLGIVLVANASRLRRLVNGSGSSDPRANVAGALTRMRLTRGTRELVQALVSEIRRGTGATSAGALVPARNNTFVDTTDRTASLPRDSALVALMSEAESPIDLTPRGTVWGLLPSADRVWVEDHEVQLLMPVRLRDDDLAAILLVGPRRSGTPYDGHDRWLVATLATAAAAAWDTAADRHPAAGPQPLEAAFECPRCGRVADTASLPCRCAAGAILAPLPHRVGEHLEVVRRLGAGGMGVVYLGRDRALHRDVALKTLPALSPGRIARLREEARVMAGLSHQGVATLYALEQWRRTPILVVEYMPHGTLADRLTRGPLPAPQTAALGAALASALVHMHGHGILHRDIKPSNIGFTAADTPKLLDLGLAAHEDRAGAPPGGTAGYLAPEALAGGPPGPSWDLWALGVVLLQAVTGLHPPSGSTANELAAALAAVPDDLRSILARMLAADPTDRPPTAASLLTALRRVRA